ncbi:hypothetical protein FBULB1_5917 [Fusarium bulbicola]|nr:hypothetical protein FBULB1_5917 [Fusarium bulbicola]
MSRAEENSAWAEAEQDYWKRVRNKKSLENEKIDNEFQLLLNEIRNRLDALKEGRTKLVIETQTKLSLINDAMKKETAHLEELRHKYRVSREMRNNENRHLWTEMRGWFREQKGEDPHTPDDKGPESEGLILRNELPGLLSATDGSSVQRELTNGTGAMADRPEEASDKRSMGGLKGHNIETAKTPEVQPKIEPTNQIKLQKVRQVEKKIAPPGQPLPSHIYEPPSRAQRTGEPSRGHKRGFQGQLDGFSKQQKTMTGRVFHQPNKSPIMRVPEQNRTQTQISGGPQSISQSPMYDALYGASGHLTAGSVPRLQPVFCFCNACLSTQRSQMGCSTTRDPPRGNLINPVTATAPWPQQDYNVHPTCPTTQNAAIRYGPNYGSPCGPPGHTNSAQYQGTSNMPSMCPQTSNNPVCPGYIGPCCGPPGYSPTAATQRLQPASNIPSRHLQAQDSQMTDPRTHSLLNPDSYGTEGRDMRSGEPTATNSQQSSQNTSHVELFRNNTVSDANSIMRGVAPSGSFKTPERRRHQAQDKEQILRDVAIMAMQVVDARVGHIKEES